MADKQLTAALSDMSVSETPPKLPNFPLPRELRDKIYGYLLDGDYTRVKRPVRRNETPAELERGVREDNSYHFHTNIMMVNHAIHEEAEEILYKRNIFVTVSYQWPGMFDMTRGHFWLLTVSRKHVARMTRHSLRIHATPGPKALADSAHQTNQKAPTESFIILAKDLEGFCFTLSVQAGDTQGLSIEVETNESRKVSFKSSNFTESKARSMQLMCELRDSEYRTMSAALQQRLLKPLAAVMAPSQRVAFTGSICDMPHIESLKRTMGPTLVYQTALFWAYMDGVIAAKDAADAALGHEKLRFVLVQYLTLESMSLRFIEKEEVRHELSTHHPGLLEACCMFHFELMIIIACAKLKMYNLQSFGVQAKAAEAFLNKFQDLHGPRSLPDGLKPYYDSVQFWAYLYVAKPMPKCCP